MRTHVNVCNLPNTETVSNVANIPTDKNIFIDLMTTLYPYHIFEHIKFTDTGGI